MRVLNSIKRRLNIVIRCLKFGYIPGNNVISWKASISKNLTLVMGDGSTIQKYAELMSKHGGSITLGANTNIEPYVILETQRNGFIKIGSGSGINAFSVVYGAGGVTIGDNTRIASHTVIVANNHNFDDLTKDIYQQGITAKGITIGNDVWIGAGAKILDGVHIGDHSVIGAGSVVTRDIPANVVAVGVPARVLRARGEKIQNQK